MLFHSSNQVTITVYFIGTKLWFELIIVSIPKWKAGWNSKERSAIFASAVVSCLKEVFLDVNSLHGLESTYFIANVPILRSWELSTPCDWVTQLYIGLGHSS